MRLQYYGFFFPLSRGGGLVLKTYPELSNRVNFILKEKKKKGLTHPPKRAITHRGDTHMQTSGWTHICVCCSAFPLAALGAVWSITARQAQALGLQSAPSLSNSTIQHLTDTYQLQRNCPSLTSPQSKGGAAGKGAGRLFTMTMVQSRENLLTVQPQQNGWNTFQQLTQPKPSSKKTTQRADAQNRQWNTLNGIPTFKQFPSDGKNTTRQGGIHFERDV